MPGTSDGGPKGGFFEGNEKAAMAEGHRIALVDKPEGSAATVVGLGIRDYNGLNAGHNGYQRLCSFLYAPDDAVVGGLIGAT